MDADKLAWLAFFENFDDSRRAVSVDHLLGDILMITVLAVLRGTDDTRKVNSSGSPSKIGSKRF